MKRTKLSALLFMVAGMLCIPATPVPAAPDAGIFYFETDLGEGLWQYDYTFNNTSDAGEYLYNVFFNFTQDTSFTFISLPVGWDGILWDGTTWETSIADTYSSDVDYDIAPGNSLGGFAFTVDYQAGDIAYDAQFSGGPIVYGTTARLAPEPLSSTFFITGGGAVLLRSLVKSRRKG
ncbi:MAG: hypothetical protein HZC49_00380 [Nitrospirae bacterium]|nr:hypothetical protein [Nitrospirota bacterium]